MYRNKPIETSSTVFTLTSYNFSFEEALDAVGNFRTSVGEGASLTHLSTFVKYVCRLSILLVPRINPLRDKMPTNLLQGEFAPYSPLKSVTVSVPLN